MKTSAVVLAASAAFLLVTLTATRPAHALGPVDLEIAGKVGYGTQDLGLGLGGRAGVSFFGFYGGLNVVEYLGKSQTIPDVGTFTSHALQFGGEVGFGFKISFLTLRPLVGFGDVAFSASGAGGSGSTSSFYVEPGGLVEFSFGHLIFGVDAGCLIIFSSNQGGTGAPTAEEAFTIHGQVGVRF